MKTANDSTTEQNKALVRQAIDDIWNGGQYELTKRYVTDDFVIHAAKPENEIHGPSGAGQFFSQLRTAFPDIQFSIVDQVAEGNKVATHWMASGTHKGNFKGIPPTGKSFRVTAIDIDHIVDGKITECWSNMDEMSLLQQLGVIQ